MEVFLYTLLLLLPSIALMSWSARRHFKEVRALTLRGIPSGASEQTVAKIREQQSASR